MAIADRISELGLRLNDESQTQFTSAILYDILTRAQVTVANMLNNRYLGELEEQETAVSATPTTGSATVTFATMGIDPLRGKDGILAVRYCNGSTGDYIWATKIDFRDIKRTTNTYLSASDTNPLYYVQSESITIMATASATEGFMEVFYLAKPTDISSSQDLTLNSALDNLIITQAEAICWGMVNDYERMNGLVETVKLEADILNARYQIPSKFGI